MKDETLFSFGLNSYEDCSQEDAFCQIFNPTTLPLDLNDEINPDKVYFVNCKDNLKNQNVNYEDFDEFYKMFAEIGNKEEINEDTPKNNFNNERASFYVDLSKEAIFCPFEDEKFINVVIKSEQSKKKKFFNSNEKTINKKNFEDNDKDTFAKPINTKKVDTEDNKYFPFTQGKGLLNSYNPKLIEGIESVVEISESQIDEIDSKNFEENLSNSEQVVNNINSYYDFKFKTKKYYIAPNGKKRREKKKRKFKSDDIRKKIKSRFHKALKNIINDSLKAAGSLKFFDFFPQCFTGNIAKKINSQSFEKTYEELLSTDFSLELSKGKPDKTSADYRKYVKNKQVLEYLEKHKEISKSSGFDVIKKKKYKELLKMYFNSKEFEDSILRLKQENEGRDYIQEYIYRAKKYIPFYENINGEKNEVDSSEE